MWELACLRWHLLAMPDTPSCLHRRQASSHRKAKQCGAGRCTRLNCGSGLARECVVSVTHELADPPPSRASPLPHLDFSTSGRCAFALLACSAFILFQSWKIPLPFAAASGISPLRAAVWWLRFRKVPTARSLDRVRAGQQTIRRLRTEHGCSIYRTAGLRAASQGLSE